MNDTTKHNQDDYGGDMLLPVRIWHSVLLDRLVSVGRDLLLRTRKEGDLRGGVDIEATVGHFALFVTVNVPASAWPLVWLDHMTHAGVDASVANAVLTDMLGATDEPPNDEDEDEDEPEQDNETRTDDEDGDGPRDQDDDCIVIEVNDFTRAFFPIPRTPLLFRVTSTLWSERSRLTVAGWKVTVDGEHYVFGTVVAIAYKDGRVEHREDHNEVFRLGDGAHKARAVGPLDNFCVTEGS